MDKGRLDGIKRNVDIIDSDVTRNNFDVHIFLFFIQITDHGNHFTHESIYTNLVVPNYYQVLKNIFVGSENVLLLISF